VNHNRFGEHPDLHGDMRVMAEFRAAITCKHGHTIAPSCGQGCRRPTWLDSLVRTEPGQPPRTVGDVVRDFIESSKIDSVEVVERYIEGEVRRERRKRYTKVAMIAGVAVASGLLLYEGGKLVLRLWTERKAPEK